jgi:hypothetical protein
VFYLIMYPWNLSGPLALSLLSKSLVPVIDPSNLKYQINHLTPSPVSFCKKNICIYYWGIL